MTIIGLGVALAAASLKVSDQVEEEAIIGRWYAEELDQSIIEVLRAEKGGFEGIIRKSANPNLVGQKVIRGFSYQKKEKHYVGTIYSAIRKMELDGTMKLESQGRLRVTGEKLFITKTFYWSRVES